MSWSFPKLYRSNLSSPPPRPAPPPNHLLGVIADLPSTSPLKKGVDLCRDLSAPFSEKNRTAPPFLRPRQRGPHLGTLPPVMGALRGDPGGSAGLGPAGGFGRRVDSWCRAEFSRAWRSTGSFFGWRPPHTEGAQRWLLLPPGLAFCLGALNSTSHRGHRAWGGRRTARGATHSRWWFSSFAPSGPHWGWELVAGPHDPCVPVSSRSLEAFIPAGPSLGLWRPWPGVERGQPC